MSKIWYYEDHGKAQGPVTDDELLKKIKKGDLSLLDLIFKEGDQQWYPVEHYTELTQQIGKVTDAGEAEWIVLRAYEVDGKNRFEQSGPYNTDQVLELVDKGKLTFNDYVWRQGYENWVSLGKVDKFEKPLVSSVEVDLSLYQLPNHQMLDQAPVAPIKTYDALKKVPVQDPLPPEAKGEDLAKPTWLVERVMRKTGLNDQKDQSVDFKIEDPKAPVVDSAETEEELAKELDLKLEERPAISVETVDKMNQRWRKVALFAASAAVLLGVVLFGSWMWNERMQKAEPVQIPRQMVRKQKAPAPAVAQSPAPTAPVSEPESANEVVTAPVEPEKTPEQSPEKTEIAKRESAPSKTEKKGDLKKEEAKPKVVALPPETKSPAPEKENEPARMEFSKMSAKQRAIFHQSERKFIFYTGQRVLRSANELAALQKKKSKSPKAWKEGYSNWQSGLRKISSGELKSSSKRLYPDLYARLKKAVSGLEETGREINGQATGRNPTKAADLDSTIAEIKRIVAKARALDE